jgi:26S proteasome non-ATPase regulatory subunit 9
MDPAIPASNGDDAKSTLRRLIGEKDVLEAQLEALQSQSAAGQPLVDAEGYPRADLDVHAVRNARSEIASQFTPKKNP